MYFSFQYFSHWYPFFTSLFAKGVTSIQLWLAFTLNYGNGCSSFPLVKLFTPSLQRVSKYKLYQFTNFPRLSFVSYVSFIRLLTKVHSEIRTRFPTSKFSTDSVSQIQKILFINYLNSHTKAKCKVS